MSLHGLVLTNLRTFFEQRGLLGAGDGSTFDADTVYADEDFGALVLAAAERAGVEETALLREFGRYLGTVAFPELMPGFYERNEDLRSCLLSVEQEIHTLVRRVLPGAAPPRLRASPLGTTGVVIAYTSERRLCPLLEGLVEGTAEKYETPITITQPQCMLRGEPACSVVVQPLA